MVKTACGFPGDYSVFGHSVAFLSGTESQSPFVGNHSDDIGKSYGDLH